MIPLVCTHTHTHTHAHTAETVKPKQAKTPPPNTRLRPRALRHGSVEEPPGLEKANNLRVYDKYELIEYNAAAAAATTTSTSTGALADPGADTSRPTLSPSLSLPLFLSLFPLANKGKRAGKQAGVNCEEGGCTELFFSSEVPRFTEGKTRQRHARRGGSVVADETFRDDRIQAEPPGIIGARTKKRPRARARCTTPRRALLETRECVSVFPQWGGKRRTGSARDRRRVEGATVYVSCGTVGDPAML